MELEETTEEPEQGPVLIVFFLCLEEGMTPHSNVLAWRIPMDRGAWLLYQIKIENSVCPAHQ